MTDRKYIEQQIKQHKAEIKKLVKQLGEVTFNPESKLFCIPVLDGDEIAGYTTHGLANVKADADHFAEWLGLDAVNQDMTPLRLYGEYRRLSRLAAMHHKETGKRSTFQLHPQLIGLEHKKIKVVYEDGETDVFTVGKSTGWMPCHLSIYGGADGGEALSKNIRFKSVEVL